MGVGVSTVVCMCATNYIEYCLICLAVWELGAAIMPVNCLIHPNKLSRQLRSTSCKVLVCDEFNLEEALEVKTKVECVETVILMAQVYSKLEELVCMSVQGSKGIRHWPIN